MKTERKADYPLRGIGDVLKDLVSQSGSTTRWEKNQPKLSVNKWDIPNVEFVKDQKVDGVFRGCFSSVIF